MLLENLGIDKVVKFGNLEDWKAAVADLERELRRRPNLKGPDSVRESMKT